MGIFNNLFQKNEMKSEGILEEALLLTKKSTNSIISENYLSTTLNKIHEIDGREFEKFMEELFFTSGYETTLTPEKRDGGIDLYVSKEDFTIAIQLKKRKLESTTVISIDEVRKLIGAIQLQNIPLKGAIITTHYFSKEAKVAAEEAKIELIDKEGLFNLVSTLQPIVISKAYYENIIEPLGRCEKCNDVKIYRYNKTTKKQYCRCINYPTCKG